MAEKENETEPAPFYGEMGGKTSPWFASPVAQSVTAQGGQSIRKTYAIEGKPRERDGLRVGEMERDHVSLQISNINRKARMCELLSGQKCMLKECNLNGTHHTKKK